MRILVAALLLVGCKHSERTHVDPDFDAFEKKWVAEGDLLVEHVRKEGKALTDADRKGIEAYHGVFIGKAGVFIDRKRVATLGELKSRRDELRKAIDANRLFVMTVNNSPMVVLDIADQPAAVAMDALSLFVGKPTLFGVPNVGEGHVATEMLCSEENLRDGQQGGASRPTLSILLTKKELFLGKSIANEFYEIADNGEQRDLEKLRTTLRELKASDDFADRTDIEIAADAGTAGGVLDAFGTACGEFPDVAILPPDRLSARPSL